jgi:hypothetical protein
MKKMSFVALCGLLFPLSVMAQSANVDELPPLNELGTGTFMGEMGGLYPNGSNTMPADFYNDALLMATAVQPLDQSGEPDEKGKIGLVAIGASTVAMFGKALGELIYDVPGIDPAIVYVNGGIGGQDLNKIRDPLARYWVEVDSRVKMAGLTNEQVQVVWMQEDDLRNQSSAFPDRAEMLANEFVYAAQQLKIRYPNLKLLYFTGRHTTAYMPADAKDKHKEPRAYLNGWATKWLIEAQIEGIPELTYKGEDAKVPLLLWGPYFWTQGEKPRQDGYTFTQDMVSADGVHPNAEGEVKVANDIIRFWRQDPVSAVWLTNSKEVPLVAEETKSPFQLQLNGQTVASVATEQLEGNVRVMLLIHEEVMYHKQFAPGYTTVELAPLGAGDYTYLIMDGGDYISKGDFTVGTDGGLVQNQTGATENVDTSMSTSYEKPKKSKDLVGEDQPAWFINGANKLPKLIRLLGGDIWAKAVFTTPDGVEVLVVEDVLHKHTKVNDILPPGNYYLKFYDINGNKINIEREIPEFLTLK